MSNRVSQFQVRFTTDGSGAVKADIESVTKVALDGARKVNNEAGEEWVEFGEKIGTAIKFAGAAVVAGVALIIKNTVSAQLELAQLDAVLMSTGNAAGYSRDQLVSMAEGVAAASTFSAGEVVKAETRLLSYSNIVGKEFPRALQLAIDQATRLGISVESSAETVGKALQTPSDSMNALGKQGFILEKGQKDLLEQLEATGKTAEAQAIIMEMMEESYAGAAEAARDTLGGALIQLKNALADVLTGDTGSEGLKGVQQAVEGLITTLNDPEVKSGFANMTEGAFDLLSALALLIGKASEAAGALQALMTIQIGGFKHASGADAIAKQKAEIALIERELASRAPSSQYAPNDVRNMNTGPAKVMAALPLRLVGAQGISGSTDAELRKRIADLQDKIQSNVDLFGDPKAPRIIEGQMLPDSVLRAATPNVRPGAITPDGGGKVKKAKKELSDFEKIMADLAVYEVMWEEAAVDASNAKIDAWERENDARTRRAEIADGVLADIQLETQAMGLSNEQLEIRNNLLAAGVSAESERGQAIVEATKQLQSARETMGALNDLKSQTTDLASSALYDFGAAGDAAEDYYDRLKRLAAQMLAEKAIQWLFSMFMGTGSGLQGMDSVNADLTRINSSFGGNRATGGGVGAGKFYEVNERGMPELLTVGGKDFLMMGSASGHVTPMDAMRGVGAAAGNAAPGYAGMPAIEFNVTNNTNGQAEVEQPQLTMENGKLIIQTAVNLAVAKVSDGLARKNSPLNKSMRAGLAQGTTYG